MKKFLSLLLAMVMVMSFFGCSSSDSEATEATVATGFFYYHALDAEGAMIAVVSMIRRSSVIVSFLCGALLFGERNLRAKALDLLLILIGMLLLAIGSN